MTNPARAYLATQVETTTQGELLLMLYEAAIKFLKRAQIEIDNRDYAKKGIYISKAMAIIHELSESLNKEKGGDITPKLGQLYLFCTTQLVKANIRLDNKMISEVIKILDGLRSAYAQIVPQHDGKGAPAEAPNQTQAPAAQPGSQASPPPSTPQPPPIQPGLAPNQAYAQTPPTQPAPAADKQQTAPESEQPKQETKPAAPQPAPPIKLKTAASAAKFRAANAYTNTVR